MSFTTNKGYSVQAAGDNPGTWGAGAAGLDLNTGVIGILDNNLGGVVSKTLTTGAVLLSASEAQMAIIRLNGTLSGNVTITTACKGFFFVENTATLGAFAVTITNGTAGAVAPAGRSVMIAISGVGVRMVDVSFPTGTRLAFQQTTTPTGWLKESAAAYENAALRLTTGTASTGGTTAFTTVFAAQTIAQANLPNVTLTGTTGNNTASTVSLTFLDSAGTGTGGLTTGTQIGPVNKTGTISAHTHAFTTSSINGGVAQTAMDFAVQYVDFCIGTRV